MIRSIRIQGFKSLHDATLQLAPVTLLVGANASGKSNLVEALQLLHWMATGQRLSDLPHRMRDGVLPIRGLPSDLPTHGRSTLHFGVELAPRFTDQHATRHQLELAVAFDAKRTHLAHETLLTSGETVPLYEVKGSPSEESHDLQVAYNNFARGGVKPKVTCVDDQPVFMQLTSPARFDKRHGRSQAEIPVACEGLRNDLQDLHFLDPRPARMRGYEYPDGQGLRSQGQNLSAVLHDLARGGQHEAALLDFVADLPEQNIAGLDFITTPRGEQMVTLAESFGSTKRHIPAALLSDGTLRVLAIAAALFSVPEGAVVVIEEIDNGVHPSRTDELLASIVRVANDRSLRVVISSHNPALQDALPLECLADVVACYRDRDDGQTRLQRLGDLDRFVELTARGSLGDLVTQQTLDRFLPQHREERAPRQPDLSFLASDSA